MGRKKHDKSFGYAFYVALSIICLFGACKSATDAAEGQLSGEVAAKCGDGKVDANEACDGSDLAGQTCVQKGFASGTLSCKADCSAIITANCSVQTVARPSPSEFANWSRQCVVDGKVIYPYGDYIPDLRYKISTDTVEDLCTGLMWEKTPHSASFNWADAKTHCAQVDKSGVKDWRLPTRVELHSLVDYFESDLPMNHAAFSLGTQDANLALEKYFWSATPLAGDPGSAWVVDFFHGNVFADNVGGTNRVRCVR